MLAIPRHRPDITEAELQRMVLAWIARLPGVRAWRANTGVARDHGGRTVRFGIVGQADITGILPGGRRLELELKAKRGKPTTEQVEWGKMITEHGGLYILARSLPEALAPICEAIGLPYEVQP